MPRRRVIQCDGLPLLEADGAALALDRDIVTPKCHAHDGLHDVDAALEKLQIFGFVSRPEQIRVGGVRLFGT